jgi:probable phosphoglycerate mutase
MSQSIDVYLVRHGEARVPWSEAQNPGLSDLGVKQAESVALELAPLQALRLISSPLLRAQETAMPRGRRCDLSTQIDDRYCEVPLASETAKRKAWLSDVVRTRWHEVDGAITAWRNAAWAALLALEHSSVIFTHFMLINAMVSRVTEDERLVCFEPDYTSVTRLLIDSSGDCKLVSMGKSI